MLIGCLVHYFKSVLYYAVLCRCPPPPHSRGRGALSVLTGATPTYSQPSGRLPLREEEILRCPAELLARPASSH